MADKGTRKNDYKKTLKNMKSLYSACTEQKRKRIKGGQNQE
jgi:hypothetical protein